MNDLQRAVENHPIDPDPIIFTKEEQTNELRRTLAQISHMRLDLETAGLLSYSDNDPVYAATQALDNALINKADALAIPR